MRTAGEKRAAFHDPFTIEEKRVCAIAGGDRFVTTRVRDYARKTNSYVLRRGVGKGEACVSPFEERVISVIVSTMRLFRAH